MKTTVILEHRVQKSNYYNIIVSRAGNFQNYEFDLYCTDIQQFMKNKMVYSTAHSLRGEYTIGDFQSNMVGYHYSYHPLATCVTARSRVV